MNGRGSQENCRRQRAALQAAIAALEDGTEDADLARLLEIEETFEEVGVPEPVDLKFLPVYSLSILGSHSLSWSLIDR